MATTPARGLSTSMTGAERIKTLHGSAIASANEDREMIEAPPRGDDPGAGPVIAATDPHHGSLFVPPDHRP